MGEAPLEFEFVSLGLAQTTYVEYIYYGFSNAPVGSNQEKPIGSNAPNDMMILRGEQHAKF